MSDRPREFNVRTRCFDNLTERVFFSLLIVLLLSLLFDVVVCAVVV